MEGEDGDPKNDPESDDGCYQCPCPGQGQSPVEARNGNFYYAHSLLVIPGFGPTLDLTLSYNSLGLRSSQFGQGWTHPYDSRIVETTDGVAIYAVCTKPNGKQELYARNPDGTYTPSSKHVNESLVKRPDGTYSLRDRYGTIRTFLASGLLSSIADRNGNELTLSYDSTGFLARITDPSGRVLLLTKGANGRVASTTDPAGRSVRFTYDGNGFLSQIQDPFGNTTRFSYVLGAPDPDSAGASVARPKSRLSSITDPNGAVTTSLTYDSVGRVQNWTDIQETYTFTYDPANKRTTKRSTSTNATWISEYNSNGNITRQTDPFGRIESYTLDADFNVVRYVDRNGNATAYSYDSIGNRLTTTEADGSIRRHSWNTTYGVPLTVTDGRGGLTSFQYDSKGNLTKATDPLGNITSFEYDSRGLVTRLVDSRGGVTTISYDQNGYAIRTTDPLGNATAASYDVLGRMTSMTDAQGRSTSLEYDSADRLVRAVDALGGSTRTEYNAAGTVSAIVPPNGSRTVFSYDANNRLTSVTPPEGGSIRFSYDRRGNLTSRVDRRGITITYSYDLLDRLVRKVRPEDTTTLTYDANSNILTAVDGDSGLGFSYDGLNRIVRTTTQATAFQPATTIQYTYDAEGNRTSMIDPRGTTNYVFDAVNQLVRMTDPAGDVYTFGYDALSRRTQLSRPGTLSTAYSYDNAGRLTSLSHGGTQVPLLFQYQYDRAGNRVAVQDGRGAHAFSYDQANRLLAATHPAGQQSESYSYDSIGNRLASHVSAVHQYSTGNRLLADSTHDYQFDTNGNVTRETERTSGRATSYIWDSENRLTQINLPDSTQVVFRYDPFGRRISKTHVTDSASFVYDDDDLILEYQSGALTKSYVHGPGVDEVLAMRQGAATTHLQSDAQGTVVSGVTSSGQSLFTVSYDSFGRRQSASGTPVRFGFQGREYDAESDLVYSRARYYSPRTGRFLSEDPVGFDGGLNFYSFAGNNPVLFADPYGQNVVFKAVRWIIKGGKRIGWIPTKTLTRAQAIRARKAGKDICALGKNSRKAEKGAKELEEAAHGADDLIHHPKDAHKLSGNQPHFQTDGIKGHTFYKAVSGLTFTGWFGSNYVTEGLDLINPLSIPRDVVDIYTDVTGEQ